MRSLYCELENKFSMKEFDNPEDNIHVYGLVFSNSEWEWSGENDMYETINLEIKNGDKNVSKI